MVLKFGMDHDKLPEEEVFPYLQLIRKRTLWQINILHQFLFRCLWYCPIELEKQPVKTPSGKYDESLRVERTQQDLNNETVNELSNLPRFQAYVKLIDESGGKQGVRTHKMQTLPLSGRQNTGNIDHAILAAREAGKKRDEIEAEIRARQDKWGRGGSPPPTRRLRD
jgi:hypothetical protein